jgi:hypothetical protein
MADHITHSANGAEFEIMTVGSVIGRAEAGKVLTEGPSVPCEPQARRNACV